MFGISWAELLVIIIVFLIFVGPEELPTVLKHIKKAKKYIFQIKDEYQGFLKEAMGDEEQDLKDITNDINRKLAEIVDLEGNIQERYDISDIVKNHKPVNMITEDKENNTQLNQKTKTNEDIDG